MGHNSLVVMFKDIFSLWLNKVFSPPFYNAMFNIYVDYLAESVWIHLLSCLPFMPDVFWKKKSHRLLRSIETIFSFEYQILIISIISS